MQSKDLSESVSSDTFHIIQPANDRTVRRSQLQWTVVAVALLVAIISMVIAVLSFTRSQALACQCIVSDSEKKSNWIDKRNTDELRAIGEDLMMKWETAVKMKDPSKLIGRHTTDTIFVRTDTDVKHGKEEVRDLYQNWYDSGVAWKDVELLDIGTLGPDYVYLVMNGTAYDDTDQAVESGKYVVIFRNEGEDGFYGFLKVEILDTPM